MEAEYLKEDILALLQSWVRRGTRFINVPMVKNEELEEILRDQIPGWANNSSADLALEGSSNSPFHASVLSRSWGKTEANTKQVIPPEPLPRHFPQPSTPVARSPHPPQPLKEVRTAITIPTIEPLETEPMKQMGHFEPIPMPHINNLDELYQEYKSCLRCALGTTRTNFVFGTGNPQAKIMFIGEGPGADEDAEGIPFVGRAGKLLTKMIQVIGLNRADVYIANMVKCRPPNNRNPEPEEMAKCFPILLKQLELVNPRLLVTLGNVPTKALWPNNPGITKCHGQVFKYQRWPVLATFHPAYLLRNSPIMETSWEDLRRIPEILRQL